MAKTIQQSVEFEGVSPEMLFEIYIDPKEHAAAIGAPVSLNPKVGGEFNAFGEDHVRGKNLALVRGQMIVQSWRAQAWGDDDLDSILTLTFVKTTRGARIDLVQANVPDHAFAIIDQGWEEHYWKPWRAYLEAKPGGGKSSTDPGQEAFGTAH